MTNGKEILDEAKDKVKQNKKGNKMKTIKEPKTYTAKQIIKAIVVIISLLAIGAYSGITINNAIKSNIDSQVQTKTAEQVKSFTEAVQE